jgi:hypothetical protein
LTSATSLDIASLIITTAKVLASVPLSWDARLLPHEVGRRRA